MGFDRAKARTRREPRHVVDHDGGLALWPYSEIAQKWTKHAYQELLVASCS